MSLADMFTGVREGLEDLFNRKPRNVAAARQPVLRGIASASEQFSNRGSKARGKWWTLSNEIVAFSPTLKGHPLVLNGKTTNHFDEGEFATRLGHFRAAVEAGELDSQIEAIETGGSTAGKSAKVSGKGGPGVARQSKNLAPRGDGLPHRVPADQPRPHESYMKNKLGTLWRSPEQVEADDQRSKQRLASIAGKKG